MIINSGPEKRFFSGEWNFQILPSLSMILIPIEGILTES